MPALVYRFPPFDGIFCVLWHAVLQRRRYERKIVRDDEMIRESAVRCARVLRVRMSDV
jgi:hypothetical protein